MARCLLSLGIFGLGLFLSLAATAEGPQLPAYLPTCPAPQPIAPIEAIGVGFTVDRVSVAWNGREYGAAWVDWADSKVHFRRFYADGTPAAPPVAVSNVLSNSYAPTLLWSGVEFALAWNGRSGSYYCAYFARLTPEGALIGPEVRVSTVGSTPTMTIYQPVMATNGSGYAILWVDQRNYATTRYDLYATLLNADGSIAGGGAYHDILVSNAADDQLDPDIAWSTGAGRYQLVWDDYRSGSRSDLYGCQLTLTGAVASAGALVITTTSSINPTLADAGNGLGLAWQDIRDGNAEIYFGRLAANGAKVGADLRLSNDTAGSYRPTLLWTGAEFGVFWYDNRSGNNDLWFQRVTGSGTLPGGALANSQVTQTGGLSSASAAFARFGYLASGGSYGYNAFVQAFGCNSDSSAPSCPGGFTAYNITGTSATIAWLPAGETATDIAYYIVYRNATPIATTSNTFYADSGLALNTTYAYAVEPVNAAQLQNYACQTTFYVKSNASLTLMLAKNGNGTDADLTWTDAQRNNYNVFRGTDPRVMSQIGATGGQAYTDPNVLPNTTLYFYTVDEPGW